MFQTAKYCFICALLAVCCLGHAQRVYKTASVLATGNWYKIAVDRAGIYRIDVPFMASLGITGNIPSAQIRLYGNGGAMLPESNRMERPDDLLENAIWVSDGGDGVLNGGDFFLFYAPGPDHWQADSVNKTFHFKKNLYSTKAFYYLNIGGTGKRIASPSPAPTPQLSLTSFDERYAHELDSVNFLNSGKEWFGEEFSNLPGRSLSKSFTLPVTDLVSGAASVRTSLAARSVNTPSSFNITVNGALVQQVQIPAVSANQYDLFAQQAERKNDFLLSASNASMTVSYTPGSFNSQGWLNRFEFFGRRALALPSSGQLSFRDWSTVNNQVEFVISGAAADTRVWDVSDINNPVQMNATIAGNQLRFATASPGVKEFIAFSGNYLLPVALGSVPNQNLHATTDKDFLIVAHPHFIAEAERLAQFHRQRNMRVLVVTTDQVFNEFSSGAPDPTAIRDYVKMYYDRYRSSWTSSARYLMLFGKGSFDYKDRIRNNTNYVPVYETVSSLDPLSTYTSDDYFGFLDDHEDINNSLLLNTLDIGIGRIPVTTVAEAKNFVDKILQYHAPQSFGAWRNELNFIADDEDQNLHLQDAEILTSTVKSVAPDFNLQKIYLDAYRQESGSAGGRYPQVNAAINSNIFNGTLLWNYSGHGGPDRLAEEVILDQRMINQWQNKNRLPLFITATCDFAPYDNPYIHSLGENLLVRPLTGAIALMTTTRVVFAFSNRIINNNYLRIAWQPDSTGKYKTLGEALIATKNYTYQTSGDISNNRKFGLLGDPAMTIAFPQLHVVATEINNKPIGNSDTLRATDLVQLKGEVRNQSGVIQNGFHGTATISIYDKVRQVATLGNDPGSLPVTYNDQNTLLFRGRSSVQSGRFEVEFRIPKDISFQAGTGRISLYAENGSVDGNGYSDDILIGGVGTSTINDTEGPSIKAYLNDEKFVNGGIVNTAPVLILQLSDSSGINTSGAGIGHDLVATLDGDQRNYFVLNNFYESDLDDYRKGTVRFQLPVLSPGAHTLQIKAWDVLNNSGQYELHFTVLEDEQLHIRRVMNYPNPFTTRTAFWFEHNMPGVNLNAKVEIFSVSGRLIKTIVQTINNAGNRSSEIEWNGADDYGSKIGRGVYLYRLRISAPDGRYAEKWEKLAILN